MLFSINYNYLAEKLPELLLAYRKGSFESSHWYEEDYRYDFEERNASLQQGRDAFPVVVELKQPIVKYTSYGYIGTQYIITLLKAIYNFAVRSSGIAPSRYRYRARHR